MTDGLKTGPSDTGSSASIRSTTLAVPVSFRGADLRCGYSIISSAQASKVADPDGIQRGEGLTDEAPALFTCRSLCRSATREGQIAGWEPDLKSTDGGRSFRRNCYAGAALCARGRRNSPTLK